jgi:hypothetical protein
MSPTGVSRAAPHAREYKVLRAARAPPSTVTSNTVPSSAVAAPAATSRAPVPIPIPGQAPPITSTAREAPEPSQAKFVLYEAVLADPVLPEQPEELAPEMQEFQAMLQEYLQGEPAELWNGPNRTELGMGSE